MVTRFAAMLALALLVAGSTAEAQLAGTLPRIGYLSNSIGQSTPDAAFIEGMQDLGYVEGRTITIVARYTGGNSARFADFAAELV